MSLAQVLGLVAALCGLVPSLLLLSFFHARDPHPEPSRAVWTTFGLGLLLAPLALAAGVAVQLLVLPRLEGGLAQAAAAGLLGSALPVELLRLALLVRYVGRHREFDEPWDGIVYGVAAAQGLATVDNLLLGWQAGGASAALAAVFGAVLVETCAGAGMGYHLGQAAFGAPAQARSHLLRGLGFSLALHALYVVPLEALLGPLRHDPWAGSLAALAGAAPCLGCVWVLVILARLDPPGRVELRGDLGLRRRRDTPGPGHPVLGWGLILAGGALACVGVAGLQAELLAPFRGDLSPSPLGAAVLGVVSTGTVPILVGVVSFALGLRILPERWARPTRP